MEEKKIWDNIEDETIKKCRGGVLELPPYVYTEMQGDFKHFMISLSRYKFAGKMLEGRKRVLEVGCNVGFKTMMLSQFVENVVGMDFEDTAVETANKKFGSDKRSYICADILDMVLLEEKVDSVLSLDVIEHIAGEHEDLFMQGMLKNLQKDGVCIIGTPNITAAEYSSELSRKAHINLYSHERLKEMMKRYFCNVFMFGMNDEVVHTGYPPMAHYLFAVGAGVKA